MIFWKVTLIYLNVATAAVFTTGFTKQKKS